MLLPYISIMTIPSRHITLITINKISKNSITLLSPNHYQMAVIQTSPIECRCPVYTDTKHVNLLLALKIIPERHSIFTLDFILLAVNSFTSKVPIALWGYQFDPFMNLSNPSFHFKLMSNFKLTNLTKTKSNFVLSQLLPITDVPIAMS